MLRDAYILAGGRSRRFGSDKARAELQGSALIRRLADRLRDAGLCVQAVAESPGKYADLGIPTLADAEPHQGPIAGLQQALEDLSSRRGPEAWMLLCSCDQVFFEDEWLCLLDSARRPGVRMVAFFRDRWEPMPGLYRADLASRIRKGRADGLNSFQKLLQSEEAVRLPVPEKWPVHLSVNRPEELETVRRSVCGV